MEPSIRKSPTLCATITGLLPALLLLAGCQPADSESSCPCLPPAEQAPKTEQKITEQKITAQKITEQQAEEDDFPQPETAQQTARRLGPPLVDNLEDLKRLDPVNPLWLDPVNKRVVMVGEVCQREAPLEMFACLWQTKEHEAVLTVRVRAQAVHAGLLAVGAEAGSPVQFAPEYTPASGTQIEILVIWKDHKGRLRHARAQDWIRDTMAAWTILEGVVPNHADDELDPRDRPEYWKTMDHPWVFAGSSFWKDQSTGKTYYQAEGGEFICVSNFSTAMLDLPIQSTQENASLMFEAFTERIPPRGTPVTIVLDPKQKAKPK